MVADLCFLGITRLVSGSPWNISSLRAGARTAHSCHSLDPELDTLEDGVEILVERMHACLDLGQGTHISGSQDGLRP